MIFNNLFILGSVRLMNVLFPIFIIFYFIDQNNYSQYAKFVSIQAILLFLSIFVNFNSDSVSVNSYRKISSNSRFLLFYVPRLINILIFCISYLILCFFYLDVYFSFFIFSIVLQQNLYPFFFSQVKSDFKFYFFFVFSEKLLFFIFLHFYDFDFYDLPFYVFISVTISFIVVAFIFVRYYKVGFNFSLIHYVLFFKMTNRLIIVKGTQLYTTFSKFLFSIFFDASLVIVYDIFERCVNIAKIPLSIYYQSYYKFMKLEDKSFLINSLFLSVFSTFISVIILHYIGYKKELVLINTFFIWYFVVLLVPFIQYYCFFTLLLKCGRVVFSNLQLLCNTISILLLFLLFYDMTLLKFILWIVVSESLFPLLSKIFLRNYEKKYD